MQITFKNWILIPQKAYRSGPKVMTKTCGHILSVFAPERLSHIRHDRANRKYIKKEICKLLSEIWRIKGLAEQEYGPQHPITKKLSRMHADAQALLQGKQG